MRFISYYDIFKHNYINRNYNSEGLKNRVKYIKILFTIL